MPTGAHIFEDGILHFCLLKRKRTVIVVTHELHFLPFAHAVSYEFCCLVTYLLFVLNTVITVLCFALFINNILLLCPSLCIIGYCKYPYCLSYVCLSINTTFARCCLISVQLRRFSVVWNITPVIPIKFNKKTNIFGLFPNLMSLTFTNENMCRKSVKSIRAPTPTCNGYFSEKIFAVRSKFWWRQVWQADT